MLAQTELVFGMLCAAENNAELQALQEELMPRLAAHYDRILLDERLFARIRDLYERRGSLSLDAEQQGCWRRPTGASCRPGRCWTGSRRPA